jgi:hypothetical protein
MHLWQKWSATPPQSGSRQSSLAEKTNRVEKNASRLSQLIIGTGSGLRPGGMQTVNRKLFKYLLCPYKNDIFSTSLMPCVFTWTIVAIRVGFHCVRHYCGRKLTEKTERPG